MRVFICDDEPLAISRLAGLLERIPGVTMIGSATSGAEAVAAIERDRPDLILLDVEMPEVDGFDVVEELARQQQPDPAVPLVAFVTAFRRFAPQAFDSGAIDFLSKPVRRSRLATTIERARQAISGREAHRRLLDLEKMLGALRDGDPPRNSHLWVQRRGELIRVDLNKVDRVAAEGAYIRLHIEGVSFLHREPIGSIESRLDPGRFIRVHRSHVVRLDRVASIHRNLHGASQLNLLDGTRLPLGRKFAKAARAVLLECGGHATSGAA